MDAVREVERLARTEHELGGDGALGLRRRRARDPGDPRPKPAARGLLVRATQRGRVAQEAWRPLDGEIEGALGRSASDASAWTRLHRSLAGLVGRPRSGPARLPADPRLRTVHQWDRRACRRSAPPDPRAARSAVSLPALLARPLLAFALEFETEFEPSSLATQRRRPARPRRAAGPAARPARHVRGVEGGDRHGARRPREAGHLIATEPDPGAAGRVVRLTSAGVKAPRRATSAAGALEARWPARFGGDTIAGLRTALEAIVGAAAGGIAAVRGLAALSRRLAGIGAAARHAPPLPDGPPPRRLPGRQLSPPSVRPVVAVQLAQQPVDGLEERLGHLGRQHVADRVLGAERGPAAHRRGAQVAQVAVPEPIGQRAQERRPALLAALAGKRRSRRPRPGPRRGRARRSGAARGAPARPSAPAAVRRS